VLNGKNILVVTPARGGSKGIPLKNLRTVNGVPLVALVGQLVRQLPWVDRAVVSTDHAEIARVAEASGLAAPFFRPEALSGDRIGDWDVLHHALLTMENLDQRRYDVVVMLQPTSPVRRPEHITAAVEKLVAGSFDAVWTVSPTNVKFHPLKALALVDDRMTYFDPRGAEIIARQQLTPVYHRNGIAYAISRECLVEQKTTLGKNCSAVVIDGPVANIDTEMDLAAAAQLLSQANSIT
jgi:CMP-N-acetylneuraminic acid synthetase